MLKLGFSKVLKLKFTANEQEGGGVHELDVTYRDPKPSEWVAFNSAMANYAAHAVRKLDKDTGELPDSATMAPGAALVQLQMEIGAAMLEAVEFVGQDVELPDGADPIEVVREHMPEVCVAVAQRGLSSQRVEAAAVVGKSDPPVDPSSEEKFVL